MIIGGLAVKRCSVCETHRELFHFNDDSSKKDGMQSACKHCLRRKRNERANSIQR